MDELTMAEVEGLAATLTSDDMTDGETPDVDEGEVE